MKAKEAPERIYLDSRKAWQKTFYDYFTIKAKANDIEYIRADAFIEKAENFIYSALNDGIMGTCDIENFLRLFKQYMKGE